MPRPDRSARCAAFLLLLVLVLCGCGRDPRPNLLLISMDTTRADHLGAYGRSEARTPAIDALAARGFLFRRHLSPAPVTLPAHSSLFTGLTPPAHGARDNGSFVLPPEQVTLAEVLREAGYRTSAFVGAFPLTARFGVDQGFEHFDDRLEPDAARGGEGMRAADSLFFDERPAEAVVSAAIAHHRERSAGPFFTFLHFFDPHQPLRPPPPYDVEFRSRPYDGEIAYVDEQIGRFLAFLEQRGELDNTLVVLTADHGEGLGEHGELTHSTLLHQATLHVPLVLAGPGIAPGETRVWSATVEVFATVLDLLGIDAPAARQDGVGRSLRPLIENAGIAPPDWAPFEAYFETIAPRAVQGASQLAAWMEGDVRYVHGPRPEQYDLDADPQELDNRHAREPARSAELLEALGAYLETAERRSVGATAQRLDAQTLQRLAGLGYIQFDPDALAGLDDMLEVEGLTDPKDAVVDVSLYSEARAASMGGHWPLALGLYRDLLRRLPDNPKAHADIAMVYAQLGQGARALDHLELAQRANPKDPQLLRQRAWLLVELGRDREGLDLLLAQDAEAIEGADCIWIALAHRRLGETDAARDWYARCPSLLPDNPWPLLLQGNFLASGGDLDAAEALYRDLLVRYPYFSLGAYNYGVLLAGSGRPEAARRLLQRAAALSPGHAPTQAALARLAAERAHEG